MYGLPQSHEILLVLKKNKKTSRFYFNRHAFHADVENFEFVNFVCNVIMDWIPQIIIKVIKTVTVNTFMFP